MDLYLIRHADALALGERGITEDALRPLSETGENQALLVGRGLKRKRLVPEKLVCSPLIRAKETANILVKQWQPSAPAIEFSDALLPDARPKKLAALLAEMGGERVGVVGHLPHLAVFSAWLLGSKKVQVELAKAGVACFCCGDEPSKGTGSLNWLVGPEWFAES